MTTFEIRNGFEPLAPLQINDMNEELRNSLWNLHEELFKQINPTHQSESDRKFLNALLEDYWINFFKQPIHQLSPSYRPHGLHDRIRDVRDMYYKLPWYKVYSFLETTVIFLGNCWNRSEIAYYKKDCNTILIRENSGYRFIENKIAPITSAVEVNAIEACLLSKDEAAKHLESALVMISNKERDQSRESIKESISAVEAIARKVTKDNKKALSGLYQKLLPSLPHNQFRQAILNLYHYTSDESGIRHSYTDESVPVDRPTAIFMLVICSAFVTLIRANHENALPAD